MVLFGQSISEISQNKDEIMKSLNKIGPFDMGLHTQYNNKNMLLLI